MKQSKRELAWIYLKESLALEAMIRFLSSHHFGAKRYRHLRILAQIHLQISQDLEEEATVDMIKLLQSERMRKKNDR